MKRAAATNISIPPRGPMPNQDQILVAFWHLYLAWYLQDNKTDAQFDAMDGAIKVLQRFQSLNPQRKESKP